MHISIWAHIGALADRICIQVPDPILIACTETTDEHMGSLNDHVTIQIFLHGTWSLLKWTTEISNVQVILWQLAAIILTFAKPQMTDSIHIGASDKPNNKTYLCLHYIAYRF